jgi:hypothetical protein
MTGATTQRRRGGYTVTNDLTLIREIIRFAVAPGFVLVGPAQRVLTYQPDRGRGFVAAVPKYEADAVAQLLDAGHLKVGGTHTVHYGDHTGPATSVLVPKATRDMVARWDSLRPLHPSPGQHGQHGGRR